MKKLIKRLIELFQELDKTKKYTDSLIIIKDIEIEIENYVKSQNENETDLIKRLEEQAVEIELLKRELNNNCENGGYIFNNKPEISVDFGFKENETVIQEVKDKVLNELDKEEEIIRHPFTVVVEVAKDFANKIQEVSDALKIKDSQDFKKEENKELEEAKEILKDWRFGKCTYSSDEIDRAVETMLTHLEK